MGLVAEGYEVEELGADAIVFVGSDGYVVGAVELESDVAAVSPVALVVGEVESVGGLFEVGEGERGEGGGDYHGESSVLDLADGKRSLVDLRQLA